MMQYLGAVKDLVLIRFYGASFLGLPTWYKYLPLNDDGSPAIRGISDFWLIGAAVLEIVVRLAGLIAVGYIIFNGIRLMVSQGNPEQIAAARKGLLQAIAGVIIAVMAVVLVNLIVGMFS